MSTATATTTTTESISDIVDVQQCSAELPDYASNLINEIATREGFSDGYTITSQAGSNHGDGFVGILIRFSIEGDRLVDGRIHAACRLSLIAKMPPHDKVRREVFCSSLAFAGELYSYDTLLPSIEQFQREKGIALADGFYQFPRCYGTFANAETNDYLIVMEDLKLIGFEMWNKLDTLDFAHAKLVLRELGKLHAISFALRDQRSDLFDIVKCRNPNIMEQMMDNDMSRQYVDSMVDMGAKTVADNVLLVDMVQKVRQFMAIMSDCVTADGCEPFGVWCHGDFWNNNMMYRYGRGRVPVEACLIDWQLSRFCSPAIDISYFMYSSTEKCLRDQHYTDMLREYHSSLAGTLQRLGSDADKLFRWTDLLEQMQRYARYGFAMAFMLVQAMTTKPANIPDMDKMAHDMNEKKYEEMFEAFASGDDNAVYSVRMRGVIEDFFESGYDL